MHATISRHKSRHCSHHVASHFSRHISRHANIYNNNSQHATFIAQQTHVDMSRDWTSSSKTSVFLASAEAFDGSSFFFPSSGFLGLATGVWVRLPLRACFFFFQYHYGEAHVHCDVESHSVIALVSTSSVVATAVCNDGKADQVSKSLVCECVVVGWGVQNTTFSAVCRFMSKRKIPRQSLRERPEPTSLFVSMPHLRHIKTHAPGKLVTASRIYTLQSCDCRSHCGSQLLRERHDKLAAALRWRGTIWRETARRGWIGRRRTDALASRSARWHAEQSTDGSRTRAGSQGGRPEVAHDSLAVCSSKARTRQGSRQRPWRLCRWSRHSRGVLTAGCSPA